MIQTQGLVAVVYPDYHGVVVIVDAEAADVVLQVRDVADLIGWPDGQLQLPDGTLVGFDGYAFGVEAADPATVTLTTALLDDLTAEVELGLYQLDVDGDPIPVVTYWATVMFDDGSQAEALIDPAWATHLKVGIREEGRRERVVCERETGQDTWILRRPIRRPPKLDLSSARAGTLPPATIGPGTITADLTIEGTLMLGVGGVLVDSSGMPIVDGADSGSLPTTIGVLQAEVAALEVAISGLGGLGVEDEVFLGSDYIEVYGRA